MKLTDKTETKYGTIITDSGSGYINFNGSLKEEIIKVLLEDPDSEVKQIAEEYLIQCLYKATEEPDKNPILHRFFCLKEKEKDLGNKICKLQNEISTLQSELYRIKEFLDSDRRCPGVEHIVWNTDIDYRFGAIQNDLFKLVKDLRENAGINVDLY